MKYLILLLFVSFCFASCDFLKDDKSNEEKGDLYIAFSECETVSDTLDICFTKIISDSRCPKNVDCIWEGLAEVEIEATWDSDLTASFTLIERAGHPELADTIIGDYHFFLNSVLPYPEDPVIIDSMDYKIDITVLKID